MGYWNPPFQGLAPLMIVHLQKSNIQRGPKTHKNHSNSST